MMFNASADTQMPGKVVKRGKTRLERRFHRIPQPFHDEPHQDSTSTLTYGPHLRTGAMITNSVQQYYYI